jgi:hypothetical protein
MRGKKASMMKTQSLISDDSRQEKEIRTLGNFLALCRTLHCKKFTGDAPPMELSRILKHRGKFIHNAKENCFVNELPLCFRIHDIVDR